MSKIKVSVIVTVFNSGDYLENCLESLKKQTLKEIEIIIINDGSSDPRDEIIIKNFTQYGSNFKCYKNENNSGTGFSREKGVGLATGEYIGFLDSDDTAEHYTYEMLYKSARDNDSEIAACNYANSYEEIEHLKEISSNNVEIVSGLNFYKCQVRRIHKPFYLRIDWWNKVYKRSMILDSGVSFPTVVRNEGTMSTFFSLLAKKCTIIDYPGFVSVNRPDSVCRNFKTKNIEDIAISIQHLHNCLRNLKTYDEHNTDFVRLYGYVLFNHNLQLIIKQPRDNRDKVIDYYLDYLSKSFFLRSFLLQYLNLPEKKIERLVFSSLCNKRNYDILRLVKKTDFFDRVEGGIVFKDRKNYLSAQKITLITITKDIISAGRVEYFEKMLSSVKNQTYGRENIEHIVVDGNSKDGTVDYLRQLDDDGIIDRWVSESDTGVYNAMNKGLLYSSGKYVLYLNSDDTYRMMHWKFCKEKLLLKG